MTKESVIQYLGQYLECSARCEYLEREIPRLENIINSLKNDIIENEVHITQIISDMPRGSTTSDPTAILAMKIANGYEPGDIQEIEAEISQKKTERRYKELIVWTINTGLDALTPKERFLVEHKYIQEDFWRNIVEEFNQQFGEAYNNKDTLKRLLNKGLETMIRVLT